MHHGRNQDLIKSRDQRMFERFYYWTEIRRLRYDDTIRKLSEEEFFISESRVMQIIRRMIQSGATCEGKQVERPQFTGFKVYGKPRPKSKHDEVIQLSLFPE